MTGCWLRITWGILSCTVLAFGAVRHASTQTAPTLEFATSDEPTVWRSTSPTEAYDDVRFRVTGDEGGWVVLALDAYCTHESAPDWIRPGTPIAVSSFGVVAPGAYLELSQPVSAHMVTTGFTDFWTKQPDYDAVRSWYVPLLSGGGTRTWSATPAMWSQSNSTYGEVSKGFWQGMTSTFASGQPGTALDFNVLAMFRWALKLRSLVDPDLSPTAVDQFLESATFSAALTNGSLTDLGVRVQVIWLSDPTLPPPATNPFFAPTLGPGPLGAVSNRLTLPLSKLPPDGGTLNASALVGSFVPGQAVTFSLGNSVAPLTVRFNTVNGPVMVPAHSAVILTDPNRYRVVIPAGLMDGPVYATDPVHPTPVPIGQVVVD